MINKFLISKDSKFVAGQNENPSSQRIKTFLCLYTMNLCRNMKCNNLLNIRSNINAKPSSIFAKVISTKIFFGVNRRSKLGSIKDYPKEMDEW